MIILNKLSDNWIQIYGSFEGVKITGEAIRVAPVGSRGVWQYSTTTLISPLSANETSNPNDCTVWNEKELLARLERNCLELKKEKLKKYG